MFIWRVNSNVNLTRKDMKMSIAYMAEKTKRNVTEADRKAASALQSLWKKYKAATGQKEKDIAIALAITQSMFNQLKNGSVTWSTNHVLKLAHFFKVPTSTFKDIPYLPSHPNISGSPREKLMALAQEVPEYAVPDAIKRIDDLNKLLEAAKKDIPNSHNKKM